MYAICGWMGRVADDHASDRILDSMLLACGASPAGQAARICESDIHLGSIGGEALIYCDAEVGVALSDPVYAAPDSEEPLGAGEVARLYRAHGNGLLERIHGSFSVSVLDLRERKVLLAVDRAGIRPLYFTRVGAAVIFTSRLAALAGIPGLERRLSDQALFDYLNCHAVPSPGTIYTGVEKLLPAQAVDLTPGGRRDSFYWRMPYRDDNRAALPDLNRQFRDLLPRVVGRAAGAPGPGAGSVGCFLSGGADSSTVAGNLRLLRGAPVRTYSTGFQDQGFDEIECARIAARHFDTDAREYCVQPQDVVDAIPRIAAYCDEPFANASIVPAYLCARFARGDGTTRLLAADGGDEIFAGNARYANQRIFEIYRLLPGWLRRATLDPVAALSGLASVPVLGKLRNYVDQARIPLPDRLESHNLLHSTPLVELFDPAFLSRVDQEEPLRTQRDCYERSGSRAMVNRMMHLDLKIALADNDLRKVNQACELAGMDVRYPLLDERLLQFAASVPPRLQLKDNRRRWFFKQALADFLPPEIVANKKHRFGLPVRLWISEFGPLRELTEDSLAGLKIRGILNPVYLDWLRARHAGEQAGHYGIMLWVLVMLEQWLRQHGH
jgi:asparagine synthase (glutamine-hydrolysing)